MPTSTLFESLVAHRPLHNDSGWWVRPYRMFFGQVTVAGRTLPRFTAVRPDE